MKKGNKIERERTQRRERKTINKARKKKKRELNEQTETQFRKEIHERENSTERE